MDISIKSLKFDADSRLIEFAEKKVAKLARFHEGATAVDVVFSLQPDRDNKSVKLLLHIPGHDLVIERSARTFEEGINDAVDAMKEKIVRTKEKDIL